MTTTRIYELAGSTKPIAEFKLAHVPRRHESVVIGGEVFRVESVTWDLELDAAVLVTMRTRWNTVTG